MDCSNCGSDLVQVNGELFCGECSAGEGEEMEEFRLDESDDYDFVA